jgi:CheY-like chemotaxis protein
MARIMIADDSPVNQTVHAFILEKAEHEVLLADNGIEAWEQLQTDKVDLLITDISMPEMDGPALLGHIRQSASMERLPVVMLTGIGADDKRLQSLAVDADALLTKPTSSWELLRTVDQLLERWS